MEAKVIINAHTPCIEVEVNVMNTTAIVQKYSRGILISFIQKGGGVESLHVVELGIGCVIRAGDGMYTKDGHPPTERDVNFSFFLFKPIQSVKI